MTLWMSWWWPVGCQGRAYFSCTYRLLSLYSWYDYDMYDTVLIHEWYCKIHTISRQCDICDAARYEPPSRTKFSPSTWTYIISYIVLYHNFIVLYQIYITTPAMVKRYVYDMYMIRFWYNLRYASTHITSTHDTHHPIQTRYAHDTHCITTVTIQARYAHDTNPTQRPPRKHPKSTPKEHDMCTIWRARYDLIKGSSDPIPDVIPSPNITWYVSRYSPHLLKSIASDIIWYVYDMYLIREIRPHRHEWHLFTKNPTKIPTKIPTKNSDKNTFVCHVRIICVSCAYHVRIMCIS